MEITKSLSSQEVNPTDLKVLVCGLGGFAFGKEKRASRMFSLMNNISPHFFVSKWAVSEVEQLMKDNGFSYSITTFGYLGFKHLTWTLDNILHMPRLFYDILKNYYRKNCDAIVFLDTMSFFNGLPAFIWLRYIVGTKLVFYVGDIPHRTRANLLIGRLANWMGCYFISNSEATRNGMLGIGIQQEKTIVAYNGIDWKKQLSIVKEKDYRTLLKWNNEEIIFSYIGQISLRKGILDFLSAAAMVASERTQVRFIIAGGELAADNLFHQEISAFIAHNGLENKIHWAGWIKNTSDIYDCSDVLVVPSQYPDPAPNVVLESMAHKCPVIGTNIGGIPELMKEGECGLLIQPKSVEEMSSAMLKLIDQPLLRVEMGIAGLRRVQKYFDLDKNAHFVETLIQNAVITNE